MIHRLPLILFFLSGTAALIYELVWFHLVQLVVGASSISVAALLASFMGGMALGSALVPRLVPARLHPLRVIAALELGMAVVGLAIPLVLPFVQDGYLAIIGYGYAGVLLRAAAGAVVLLPPTMMMGATLPVISRLTGTQGDGTSRIGLFYMANITGGACGTVLAGFYLLRVFDTVTATWVAVGLNLIAAGLAWALAARQPYAPSLAVPGLPSRPLAGSSARLAVVSVVAMLSGLTALGAEVVWTRQLSLLFGASVYTFSLILAVFLTGLGLGSVVGSALTRRTSSPLAALGWCQLLIVLAVTYAARAIVDVLPIWQPTATFLPNVRSSPGLAFTFDALRCAVALLPATILWGASFPLALAAAADGTDPGRTVARVNALNTVGSLIGAVGFTLVGIPMLGSQHAQQALVVIAALAAAIALIAALPPSRRLATLAAVGVSGLVAFTVVPAVPGQLIAYGRSVNSWASIARFLYLEEGATSSVAVTEGTSGARQFHVAGKVEASDMDVDMRLERMLGHIPALVHPNPRKILVVGVGAGVTAGSFTVHPEVERIVVCEIEPVVPASARAYFGNENHHVFDDPRTTLVFDDARHFLQTTTEKFDIITSDPIHPWVRGAATLYSAEYLQLVREHLEPGGVVTQWVPLYETDERSVKSQIATFAQVFPDMTLWNPDLLEEGYDLVVLGRVAGGPISEGALDARLAKAPLLRESLGAVRLATGRSILATYAGRGADLAPWMADAAINRERHLRLQYLAGLAANIEERFLIFQRIVSFRRYPADLFDASEETESMLRKWLRD